MSGRANSIYLCLTGRALRQFRAAHRPAGRATFRRICRQGCGCTKRLIARLAEPGPDSLAYVIFTQIAKDGAGIVHLIGERDTRNVIIGLVEVPDIGRLSLLPVLLSFALGCVSEAVRARFHHLGHPIAEPVLDVLQPCIAALIVSQAGDPAKR